MEKENIIVLDDDSKYMLLDETNIEEYKFFFAVKLNENDEPTTQYEVFKEVLEEGEIYIDILDDSNYKQALLIDFTNNYMNKIGELIEKNN